ncbi:hypothetical protein [Flavobacterium terrisoli]|uniref:hypothetical protein n=1 Tax=Flavobacterium terrisoli TaxID=3242195 RepID=UPI002543E121|nr:hypothetical protein [Flavobacterium buctense]
MSAKQFIVLGKLWVLLLFGNSAFANTVMPFGEQQESKAVTLYKAVETLHKDGLQPQVPSVRIISEQQAKSFSLGYPVIGLYESVRLVPGYVGPTVVLLQDADRCKSVSRFLFPYHFFW